MFFTSVLVKGSDPFSVLCAFSSKLFLSLFPPLSSHLICSSFCWTPLCPSPTFHSNCSTHNPTLQHILYQPPPPLLFSFLVPHAEVHHSPGHTSSHHRDGQCVSDRGHKLGVVPTRAVGSVCTQDVNAVCLFICCV